MSDGPAATASEQAPSMLGLVLRLSEGHAALQERVSTLERTLPEVAARLDGRFSSVEAQIARQADHLAQQDQAAERARLEQKSRDGLIQQRLEALTAAEQQRAQEAQQAAADAKEAQQRTQEAQERAREQAAEQRTEYRRWALQTVVSVGLMLPGLLWPLVVTRPLPLRLGVPAMCIALVLLLAAWAWARSRR